MMDERCTLIHLSETMPFHQHDVRTHRGESLHEHLVMVARFRHTNEAVKSHDLAHSLTRSALTTKLSPTLFLDIIGVKLLWGGAPMEVS